ncbi:MAG: hypothetical protein WA510_29580 [Acidobacteriaceae bacterium]
MKRMFSITVKPLLAILICSGLSATAHAQYDEAITVNVPFAFSADGQEMAEGTYQLQLMSSQYIMLVRNVSTGNKEILRVHPEQDRRVPSQGDLVFQACKGNIYLTEIHSPGASLFSETVSGHKRHEATSAPCSKDHLITVALR